MFLTRRSSGRQRRRAAGSGSTRATCCPSTAASSCRRSSTPSGSATSWRSTSGSAHRPRRLRLRRLLRLRHAARRGPRGRLHRSRRRLRRGVRLRRHDRRREAAAELSEIALRSIEARARGRGAWPALLHIDDPDDPETASTCSTPTSTTRACCRFPFGVAGTSRCTASDWKGCREVDFPGGRGLVPVSAEEVVEHLYGDGLAAAQARLQLGPRPHRRAPSTGLLPTEQRTKVYWANFYARTEYSRGSTFFEFVNARPDTPETVVDIGCGDGRDPARSAPPVARVLGLDQSPVGIEHAAAHAGPAGLADRVAFRGLRRRGRRRPRPGAGPSVRASEEPMMFYLRFFLHAIAEEVQDRLLDAIAAHARPGDFFAAEFRTDKDEANSQGPRRALPPLPGRRRVRARLARPGSRSSTRRRAPGCRRTRARTRSSTAWWRGVGLTDVTQPTLGRLPTGMVPRTFVVALSEHTVRYPHRPSPEGGRRDWNERFEQ